VRQLIHQRDLRSACQYGAEVHISGGCAGERRCSGRNDLQTFQHPGGDGPPACLHAGHDHVGALLRTPVTLTEQRASRGGSRRDTQVNPKPPPDRPEPH
jgi:hypothetical protein